VAQVVECLPGRCKALSSNSITIKKTKQQQQEKHQPTSKNNIEDIPLKVLKYTWLEAGERP
jgi:hypothetical protein